MTWSELPLHREVTKEIEDKKEITLGKLLGFLGVTADVTGFSLDPPILFVAIIAASFLQFMKNEAQKEKEKVKGKHPT